MSGYSTAVQLACVPGPRSAAAVMTPGAGETPVLVVFLDPINLTIRCPARSSGLTVATLCRELAREASRFADMLDPVGAAASRSAGQPRHALAESGDDASTEGTAGA